MKISVIIPVYNTSKWLNKLWDSLNNQTIFDMLEIIFVNDGSTDNSLSILEKLTKKTKNVIIYNQKNKGVSAARNVGINNSSCDYITFIDSDDYLEKDYFEVLLNNSTGKDIVITGFVNDYYSKSVVKKPYKYEIINNNKDIVKSFLIGKIEPNSTNKLFSRNIIDDLRFDETYTMAEDKFFVYEYIKKCNKAVLIPEAKYHYNHTNDLAATKKAFDEKKLSSIMVSERICKDIKVNYEELYEYALSSDIDVKCRVYCDIYKHNSKDIYKIEYNRIKKDIKKYSLIKKMRYSNKKHSITLFLAKIHPRAYLFFKDKLKLQYK